MKIKSNALLLFLLMILSLNYYGADSEQISIPLSNSGKPGLLSVNHYKGTIKVTGYSGEAIVITAGYRISENNNGMKLISGPAHKLTATEKDNVVFVSVNSFRRTIDLDIRVPRNFSLKLSTDDNGEIVVRDINGVFELNNNNGDVKLFNVSGSSVISTIDGNIYADFLNVDADLPMVLSTIEGNINLNLPVDSNICLKMRTEYGEVYSDFIIDVDKRKTNVSKHKRSGSTKITLDQWTYGKINKGGPEYLIKSLNGNIYIKKKK